MDDESGSGKLSSSTLETKATTSATTSKTSKSLKSNPGKKWCKFKYGLHGLKLETGHRVAKQKQSSNKPQNYDQQICETSNIFNIKKLPVTANGGVGGGGQEILQMGTGNSDRNVIGKKSKYSTII